MPDPIQGTDKMLLGDFIGSISQQYVEAISTLETKYPQWRFPKIDILVRAVVKPGIVNGKSVVIIDVNEPKNEPISEIPITIRRIPVDDVRETDS